MHIDNNNIDEYYKEIEEYATYQLGFHDNSHVDKAVIYGGDILVEGIFREEEPDDWLQYEEDGFPNDVYSLEINLNDFINNK